MDLSHVPGFVSAKLAALSDARAAAATRSEELAREIANLRDRFNGKIQHASDARTDFPREIDARLAEQQSVTHNLAILSRIVGECRAWLASLPSSAALEQVTTAIETGLTLQATRARIDHLEKALTALKRIPLPSVDIKTRVEAYVQSLTKPLIRGVAAGETLTVEWPGPPRQFAAPPPADLFVLAAFLQPEQFATRLLATIQRAAPPADRSEQIKDLEQQIENAQRAEETLIVSTGAARESGRPPQVILCCKVATSSRGARAA